jgi:molybdopterin-binding protein
MRVSARNQIKGTIKEVKKGDNRPCADRYW